MPQDEVVGAQHTGDIEIAFLRAAQSARDRAQHRALAVGGTRLPGALPGKRVRPGRYRADIGDAELERRMYAPEPERPGKLVKVYAQPIWTTCNGSGTPARQRSLKTSITCSRFCATPAASSRLAWVDMGESRGAKSESVQQAVAQLASPFTIAQIEQRCPGVSRELIQRILKNMKEKGMLTRLGRGLGARWTSADPQLGVLMGY